MLLRSDATKLFIYSFRYYSFIDLFRRYSIIDLLCNSYSAFKRSGSRNAVSYKSHLFLRFIHYSRDLIVLRKVKSRKLSRRLRASDPWFRNEDRLGTRERKKEVIARLPRALLSEIAENESAAISVRLQAGAARLNRLPGPTCVLRSLGRPESRDGSRDFLLQRWEPGEAPHSRFLTGRHTHRIERSANILGREYEEIFHANDPHVKERKRTRIEIS